MKKLLFALAAVAMLFTACNKDRETPLENNTLVYDGVTYQFRSEAILEGQSTYLSYFAFINDNDNFQGHIDGLNKTFDLTKPQNFMFDLYMFINQTAINLTFYDESSISGQIGDTQYSGESIFSTGTFTNSYNNSGVTCELNGTLKNGKKLAYKVFVPESEIQRPPHK
ncbi:MAG: hypothetical protein J6P73_09105 [Bacteroidales bacterium]|nr:hypothetical protein [Bacteroidales bacterium]